MAKQVMPEAELEARDSDVPLTDEQFLKISLFAQLKRKPTLEKYPGALRLRRYHKGEVMFRQGEAGWTALYTLTTEDVATVLQDQLPTVPRKGANKNIEDELAQSRSRLIMLTTARDINLEEDLRRVGTVHLAIPRHDQRKRRGLFGGLFGGLGRLTGKEKPLFIPIDGPRDVDYSTMQAPICEGELVGEMSCMYRTPRSATAVASRDCYLLEMLRNILDQLQKDPGYKAQTDELYKKRVFQMHLRNLSIFSDLTEEQFNTLRDRMELVSLEPGELVFDEFERPDSFYIIRSGLVKVLKKASALLSSESVRSWGGLFTAIREGEQQPTTPRGKVWQLLPDWAREVLTASASNQLALDDQSEVLYGLNEVIKNKQLPDMKEFQEIKSTDEFKQRIADFPEKRKDWDDMQLRRHNRQLVDAIYPGIVRNFRQRVGPELVLSYLARGEFLGEMGLISGEPRSATCIAFGHPEAGGKESGRVELVRIPGDVFFRLLDSSPNIQQKVERQTEARKKRSQERSKEPVWKDTEVQHSERFEQLGLIQGQKLMVIDLDRCTRCDECVKACVNTHDDGRSRLFLDGPRFGHYLVPVTCRSCLDPVCMIGCPVGSIHRGDAGQIIIENWCIGCGLCAGQCPYGSIQMHDIGIVAEAARGWRYIPAPFAGKDWYLAKYNDRQWLIAAGPFRYDRELKANLQPYLQIAGQSGAVQDAAICFRYEFNLASYLLQKDSQFKMEVTSSDDAATVWVNGAELKTKEKPKRGKREFHLPMKEGDVVFPQFLRVGRNVVAVRATPKTTSEDVLMSLRLDAIPKVASDAGEEVTQKLVTEEAVVCDLCSTLKSGPACVTACPHEAALRVDARFEFPMR